MAEPENTIDNSDAEVKKKDLSSVYTTNLASILKQFKISLAVSTYQSGKLILIREDGNAVNTHFRSFNRPMGVAVKPNQISIGCFNSVINYYNIPALIPKLDTPEKYDACYVPRRIQETGAIDIHEMAWGSDNKLWFVNTKFSCLCTIDSEYSFRPEWRPGYISGLGPEDRCHLNGLGMKNGKPKFVTALGEVDGVGEWRKNKRNGGLLIDVETDKILLRNLSMPHSPRWYDNKIWFLESGYGALSYFDTVALKKVEVARVPGFTRGIDFIGNLAFVGLSQVRETAVFEDFPLLEEVEERICGVYVVDIRNGKIVGFIKFEGDVEEIFAVQILHNTQFPEIMEFGDKLLNSCYIIPDESLKDVSVKQRLPEKVDGK
jgi:uncharacterized protein (TIGR03032 family)